MSFHTPSRSDPLPSASIIPPAGLLRLEAGQERALEWAETRLLWLRAQPSSDALNSPLPKKAAL